MNDNNLPKVDINVDFTKTVEDAYTDGISKPLKSSSKAFTTLMDFFHNTVLYPMQKYNLYANNKLENYAIELQNKVKTIPAENLVSPRVNILGPTIDGLKYNLDEEYIKEMFTNILMSDMDDRTQNKVLPSYIEIVKQLSKDDAKFITNLKSNNLIDELPIIKLKLVSNEDSSFNYISPSFICLSDGNYLEIPQIVLDNLTRLQILEVDYETFFQNATSYNKSFENLKKISKFIQYSNKPNKHIEPKKGLLLFTSFGKNFIDVSLS